MIRKETNMMIQEMHDAQTAMSGEIKRRSRFKLASVFQDACSKLGTFCCYTLLRIYDEQKHKPPHLLIIRLQYAKLTKQHNDMEKERTAH